TIAPLRLEERFGPRRARGGALESRHLDIACSLQKVLEETVLEMSRWLFGKTGAKNLCLAGGVALNCVMNARVRDEATFQNVWVEPAAGDAGTALGAALAVDAQERPAPDRAFWMEHAYWGPGYPEEEIEQFLQWTRSPYRRPQNLAEEAADLLARDRIM